MTHFKVKPYGCFLFRKEKGKQGLLGIEGRVERFADKLVWRNWNNGKQVENKWSHDRGTDTNVKSVKVLKEFTTECITAGCI